SSAEYALETEVGQQADVSFFYCCHIFIPIFPLQKYEVFFESARKRRNFLYIRDIICDNTCSSASPVTLMTAIFCGVVGD
ncbi:MAG: hypothetical protein MR421_10980, partial [Prevotella sp.]|nr:hypothetical protein [Prevotella sp.]